MSGHHDLGGKPGYGPVDVGEKEEPFHAEFEGRMWAISRLARHPDWTIDWWRHVRENIPKEDYLNRPYFDSWAQTHMAAFIDAGAFDLTELLAAPEPVSERDAKFDAVEENKKFEISFEKPARDPARYGPGDAVRTRAQNNGHTRLPEYAALKTGWIEAYRGAHVYPDESAKGTERGGHLYTVGFRADELWPCEGRAGDKVFLDLWEEYLTDV